MGGKPAAHKLNPKQAKFVQEYLKDLNAQNAAIRAGYSERTARQIGCQLLTNINVSSAIEKGQQRLAAKIEVTQERIVKEYARIAFLDPRKVFNDDGTLKPIKEFGDDEAAALAGLEVSEITMGENNVGNLKKVKLADKKGALDSLARHLGMFVDKSVTVNLSLADVLNELGEDDEK